VSGGVVLVEEGWRPKAFVADMAQEIPDKSEKNI
jgi:hypothetical protein